LEQSTKNNNPAERHDKEGKIGVTRKDDVKKILGFSPDFADALMMRMVFELPIKKFAKMM